MLILNKNCNFTAIYIINLIYDVRKVRFVPQKVIIWVANFGEKAQNININQPFSVCKSISINICALFFYKTRKKRKIFNCVKIIYRYNQIVTGKQASL